MARSTGDDALNLLRSLRSAYAATPKNLKNLRPEIPRCCPSAGANVMKRCWDAVPDKRPEMDEVVAMLKAIDTSCGGGMIPNYQAQGCFCLLKRRGP